MKDRIDQITNYIQQIDDVSIINAFIMDNESIHGKISVEMDSIKLLFDVLVLPVYPLRFHDSESIEFSNIELLEYDHVMKNGHICIHTVHYSNLQDKINHDVNSLKKWIRKYYINKETDIHYEHIITPWALFNNEKYCYLFTETDFEFKKGDYGILKYSALQDGQHNATNIHTLIIQEFIVNNKPVFCKWSKAYRNLEKGDGIYVYIENPPIEHKRFIVEKWSCLAPFINQNFMHFMQKAKERFASTTTPIPLFIGYKIPGNEIHWQCAAIDLKAFPIYSERFPGTRIFALFFKQEAISWMMTQNSSYHYFFGRGLLNTKITNGKILMVGVGAIGSMVATTLVRGGCRYIALADFDIKEPGNVCRSEYNFITGINSKVHDLRQQLVNISPHVEVLPLDKLSDAMKICINNGWNAEVIKKNLDEYDFIIDCTADNDFSFILDKVDTKSQIINLSISNEAKELVCIVKPELCEWLNEIYNSFPNRIDQDLYNPIGCWNPTFRASYNDVSIMVQYAIKQINFSLEKGYPLKNFVLSREENSSVNIKLIEY